jgi:hypothetical protein
MRWAGHVARMGEGRNVYRFLVGKPEGKNHLKDQGVDGRVGSKWTLGRLAGGGVCGVGSPGSGYGPLAGCCECGDEPSGSSAAELVVGIYNNCKQHILWPANRCSRIRFSREMKVLLKLVFQLCGSDPSFCPAATTSFIYFFPFVVKKWVVRRRKGRGPNMVRWYIERFLYW